MATPRQRRKARSSAHKATSHSRRAKRLQKKMPAICGPKALQDAWDPSKTVRQNYLALGLQHDLNPISSGGSEVHATGQTNAGRPSCTMDGVRSSGPAVAFGRIVRDASGSVVRVELPSDEDTGDAKGELAIDAPAAMAPELRIWARHPETARGTTSGDVENAVVQDLEAVAASAAVRERHTSFGERSYLERLVRRYGDALDQMARDRRLNPEQRTANALRRAIAKAGGRGALCTDSRVVE